MLVIARKAGPELFGTISLFFTMAEIARVIGDCGIDTSILRNMATERGPDLARSLGAAVLAKLFASALVGSTLLILMFRLSPNSATLNISVALLALSPLVVNPGANYFIATQRPATVLVPAISLTVTAAASMAATAILVRDPVPLLAIVAGYEVLLGTCMCVFALRTAAVRPALSGRAALELLQTAFPLGIAITVGYAYGKLDIFVINHCCGVESVGQYAIWSRLLDPFLFICGAIAISAYGHLSRTMHEGDKQKTRRVAHRYILLSVSVSACATGLMLVAGGPLARRFLPSFAPSLWIGELLGLLLIVRSLNMILTAILQAAAKRKLIMGISLLNLAIALAATTLLGRMAGVFGVVCGLLFMESVNFAIQASFAQKSLRLVARTTCSPHHSMESLPGAGPSALA